MIYKTDEDPNWFYVNEGRRQGPLDRRGLVQALLALEVPEKTLVWRTGLNAWTKAGDLQELRIELPPPIPREADPSDPTPPPPLPTEDGTTPASGATPRAEADDDEEDDEEDVEPTDGSGAPTEGRRRRRRRKRKHSEKSSHNPRVLELLALFLVLALVLWFLLRRMNRVPEGTIIYQGLLRRVPEAVTPPPPYASWREPSALEPSRRGPRV